MNETHEFLEPIWIANPINSESVCKIFFVLGNVRATAMLCALSRIGYSGEEIIAAAKALIACRTK